MEDVVLRDGALVGESDWTSRSATWPFMLLTISPTRLKLATSWLPPLLAYDYEFRKEAIQALVLRKYSLLPGIAIAHLAITHNLPNIPSYIRFGAFEPGSAALRFAVSRLFISP